MAFTKVVGAGIHTLSNIASHNINSSGIITATKFVGPFDGSDGDFSGNVTIDGNLTVNGTTTTLDTNLTEVDKVEVAANNSTVGVAITQSGSGDILNLYDGSTKKLVVDDQGNVGIKTLAPAHDLDVYLNGRFNQLGAGGYGALVGPGTHTGGFTYMSSGDMEISCAMTNKDIVFSDAVGGNERMRLTGDTGRLGIGTDNPQKQLQILGNADTCLRITSSSNGVASLQLGDVDDTVKGAITFKNDDNSLRIRGHNNDDRIIIDSSGRIGIDYTPGSGDGIFNLKVDGTNVLHIGHGTNKDNYFTCGTSGIQVFRAANAERLRIDSSGRVLIGTTTEGQANADEFTISFNNTGVPNGDQGRCGMTIRSGSNTSSVEQNGYIYFSNGTSGDNEYKGTIVYEHANDALKFGTNGGAERLRITSAGEVKINYAAAGQTVLSCEGLYDGGSNTSVDIATFARQGNAVKTAIRYNDPTTSMRFGTTTAHDFGLMTGGTERLHVSSTGQVGISNDGTTDGLLTIKGNSDATGTPSIRLLDGTDTREVSISNSAGDFIASTHGTDNVQHGFIKLFESGIFTIATGGTDERFRITTDGQISAGGGGTAWGNALLSLITPNGRSTAFSASDGDTWHDMVIKNTSAAANNAVGLAFQITGNAYHKNAGTGICAVKNGTNSDYGADLVFITRPQSAVAEERLRITSGGNVGINVTNPQSKLEVEQSLTTQSETDKRIAIFRKNGTAVGDEGYIHLTTMTGHYGVKLGFANEGASPTYLNQGFFISTVHGNENITNHVKRFVIKSNGDVGIGYTVPNARLHIASGTSSAVGDATNPALQIGSTANYRFAVHTTNEQAIIGNKNGDDGIAFHTKSANSGSFGEALRIDSSGRLLVGRTSVSNSDSKMEIQGSTDTYLRIASGDTGGSAGIIFGSSDDHSTGGIYYANADDSLQFAGYNNTTRLRIASNGGHKITCEETYYAANLTECNTGQLALNINKTRQGQTKGIALGAIGNTTTRTGIQCYDTSDNSANTLLLNPFGGRVGINITGEPSAQFEVADDSSTNQLHVKHGWASRRFFSLPIINNETRWYKIVNYAAGNMLIGSLQIYTTRQGGFNQTKGYNEWKVSYVGFNDSIYGTGAENSSFYAGTGSSVDIVLGDSPKNVYIKIPGSIYGGYVYMIFEGIINNWQLDSSSYVTTEPS